MALQKNINGRQVLGIVGEFSDDSPKSARSYIVFGKDNTSKPTFGKFFAFDERQLLTGSSEKTTVAKQGVSASTWTMGILVNPKESFTNGFVTSTSAGTFVAKPNSGETVPNATVGTIATRGHIWVMSNTTTVAGEYVYADANGNLGDVTLAGGVKVIGAKWLRSVALGTKTEVMSEIAIDNPYLNNELGPSSL